ncbi:MAG: endonuclease/exonuclease/phosphatase family protein [Bryobacterales bacterium]|nr:endonuclease/exonuclease/phosphatase family protein [Bryobacterales bacterium]
MKTAILLMLATFPLLAQNAQVIRVLSYNIHHGEGSDAKIDLDRIAKVILSAEPDLVAVQEVDVRTTRVAGVDQAHELAKLTGMHVIFGRTIPYRTGWYGNALLSKWPVNHYVNHEMPFTPGRERRGVIEALMLPPPNTTGGSQYHMLATHLDTGEADRLLAARRLRELVAERPEGWPMIIAGDMNAVLGSATMRLLGEDWTPAQGDGPLFTIPVENPTRQIDFVMFRPASRWKVLEARVLPEAVASDHRPILAVLELMPE